MVLKSLGVFLLIPANDPEQDCTYKQMYPSCGA